MHANKKRAPVQRKRVNESHKTRPIITRPLGEPEAIIFTMIVIAVGAIFLEAAKTGTGVFA